MKLIDRIKNAIFEDDEIEGKEPKELKKEETKIETPKIEEEVVRKIDIEKTIPKRIEIKEQEPEEEIKKPEMPKREHRRTPVIFDEEDFIMEEEKMSPPKREVYKTEEIRKPLYGGYKEEKAKEKFKPSPVISPVYGYVSVSPVLEKPRNNELSSFNEMFAREKKEEVTLDDVRQKAYGIEDIKEEDDDLGLLYDMKKEDKPAISKITLGDAEEYFEDLGLEYNVDYKDSAKEKNKKSKIDETEEITSLENIKEIESEKELEITKEQIKPRSAKEIKKVKKITDLDLEVEKEEPEEKNLYDLIDMMYDSKE